MAALHEAAPGGVEHWSHAVAGEAMTASAHDVARELRSRLGGGLDTTKLHKLLFYVQAWSMAWRDEPSFAERIEAFPNGPVVETLRAGEKHGWAVPPPHDVLDDGVIDFVVHHYGGLTKQQLIAATHREECWREARLAAGDDLGWLSEDPDGERWQEGNGIESRTIELDAMAMSVRSSALFASHEDDVRLARTGWEHAVQPVEDDAEAMASLRRLLDL